MYRSEVFFHKAAIDGEQVRYSGENNIPEKKRLLPELTKPRCGWVFHQVDYENIILRTILENVRILKSINIYANTFIENS